MRNFRRPLVAALFLSLLLHLVLQAQEPAPNEIDDPFSPFLLADQAVSVYEAYWSDEQRESLESFSPVALEKIVARVSRLIEMHAFHAEDGGLSEEGCVFTNASNWEDLYANTLDQKTTLIDLVRKAPQVVLTEIIHRAPVMIGKGPVSTRYRARVVETWSGSFEVEDEIEFFDQAYVLEVAGARLCVTRRAVTTPEEGEIWLLLGARDEPYRLKLANFFRVRDGWVEPQDYPFLVDEVALGIDRLR